MNSLLDFIYVLFFVPGEAFLYISLSIITIVSLSILARHSLRSNQDQNDLEASSPLFVPTRSYSQSPGPLQQANHASQTEHQPNESETEPTDSEYDTYRSLPPSSDTSTGTHAGSTPPIQPLPILIFGSQRDSLLETGSIFANDSHDSNSPLPVEADNQSESSSSSLELSD